MTAFHIIIPARLQSARLPGKVLADIAGKPMLQHVYERAKESGAQSVIIATDDQTVMDVAKGFAENVLLTAKEHCNATDRIAEVISRQTYQADDIIVNVQADEPLLPAALIEQVADALALTEQAQVASLCTPINDTKDLLDPNVGT